MSIQEKLYTAEDLREISHRAENDVKRLYLMAGVLYEMSPTGWQHGDLALELGALIRNHVKAGRLGRVTPAETGYILNKNPDPNGKDTVLAPDVGFVAAARIRKELPEGYVPFAPDLAVEVVSPGNSKDEVALKIESYLRYGTRLLWVVYPKEQRVHVYQPSGDPNHANVEFLGIEDTLDGGKVLPGFQLRIRELFETDE